MASSRLCRYLPKQLLRFCQGNHQVEQHGDDSVATEWPNLQEAGSREGQRFTKSESTPESRTLKRHTELSRWNVVDACRELCPAPAVARPGDYRIQSPSERSFLTFAATAHLVVVDSLADLAVESSNGPFGMQLQLRPTILIVVTS